MVNNYHARIARAAAAILARMNGLPICGLLRNTVRLSTAYALLCLGTLKFQEVVRLVLVWDVNEQPNWNQIIDTMVSSGSNFR